MIPLMQFDKILLFDIFVLQINVTDARGLQSTLKISTLTKIQKKSKCLFQGIKSFVFRSMKSNDQYELLVSLIFHIIGVKIVSKYQAKVKSEIAERNSKCWTKYLFIKLSC